ncbi:hypothetical protein [Kordia sp.]|uniref:hypothetical protein n=1 Tax=Kordia sp. TaxID=1965332 RepID=UPI003B58D46D
MIFTKKISLLLLFITFVSLSFGQEEVITIIEQEAIDEDYREDPKVDGKKKPKRLPRSFKAFRYEFKANGNEVQYVTVKNKATEPDETIEIIPVDDVEDLDIIPYNFGFEYHKAVSHRNDIERHYYENYIVYRNKKKYGLVLTNTVISAKFDIIGKPYLIRGEDPMILVAKKKRGKYKWGIVKSDGSFLLPMEYSEIILPLETDVAINSSGRNSKEEKGTWANLSPPGLFTDGLYHNHKIIVKKKGKYGLYNANGEKELAPEYDHIEVNKSLDIYTLQKDGEFGFLIAEYKKKGFWGIHKFTAKNTRVKKYLKIFPTKDYQIFIKDKQAFIKDESGTVSKVNHRTLLKMVKE